MRSSRAHALTVGMVAITIGIGFGMGAPSLDLAYAAVLAAGAIAVHLGLLTIIGSEPATPSLFEAIMTPSPITSLVIPDDLIELRRRVLQSTGRAGAGDLHYRLGPILKEIADAVIVSRRTDPRDHRVVEVLGPQVWDLIRPDRPAPADRSGPGMDIATLQAVVATLEAMRP